MDIMNIVWAYMWTIFLLILPNLCSGARKRNCESDCLYKPETKKLICEGRGISCIPTPCCLQGTRHLNLAQNNIDMLPQHAFQRFPNLRTLVLRENSINHIAPGAFFGLMSLSTLDMRGNQLNRLRAGSFSGMPNLRHLNLADNSIHHVEAGAFIGLPMLMYLKVNDNDLQTMKPGMFEPLRNLLELHLQNNQINTILDGALYGLNRLRVIVLSENDLMTLPDLVSSLPNLRTISLEGNPLTCDCHLEHLRRWFALVRRKGKSNVFPRCAAPPRLNGRDISTLSFPLTCRDVVEPDQSEESVISKPTQSTAEIPRPPIGGADKVNPPSRDGILGNDLPTSGGKEPTRDDTSIGRPTISDSGTNVGSSNNGQEPTAPGKDSNHTTLPRSTARPRVTLSGPQKPSRPLPPETRPTSGERTGKPATPVSGGTGQGGQVLSFDGFPPVLHPDYEFSLNGVLTDAIPPNSSPTDERPTSGNPTDRYPSNESPIDGDPTTESPINGNPNEEVPTGESPTNEHPTNEQPTNGYPGNENPSVGPTSDLPGNGNPTAGNGRPTDGNPSAGNGRPFDGNPSLGNGHPHGGYPSSGNGRPFDGNPHPEYPSPGYPTDGNQNRGNSSLGSGRPFDGRPFDGNPAFENPTYGDENPTNGPSNGNPSFGSGVTFDGHPPDSQPTNGNPNHGVPTPDSELPGLPGIPPNQPPNGTPGNAIPPNRHPPNVNPGNEFPSRGPTNEQPYPGSPLPGIPTPNVPPAGTPPEAWGLKGSKMYLDCGNEAHKAARSGSRVKWLTPSGGVVNQRARGRFVVASNGSLVVSRLQGADTGAYRCIIRNDTTTRISLVRLQVACPCGITEKNGHAAPDVGVGTTIEPPNFTPETRSRRTCNITPVVVAVVTTFQATVALCSIIFCAWYSRCGNREQWKSRVNAAEHHPNVNTVDKAKEASLPNSWRSHSYEAVCSSLESHSSRSTSPTDSISSSCDHMNSLNEYVNSNVMRHYSEDYVDLDPQSRTTDDTYSSLTRQSRRAAAAAVANRNKNKCVSIASS